jgi:hypothetical protein
MSVIARPCPFCGANMLRYDGLGEPVWAHPGVVTDGKCLMAGRAFYKEQVLKYWNMRAEPVD